MIASASNIPKLIQYYLFVCLFLVLAYFIISHCSMLQLWNIWNIYMKI